MMASEGAWLMVGLSYLVARVGLSVFVPVVVNLAPLGVTCELAIVQGLTVFDSSAAAGFLRLDEMEVLCVLLLDLIAVPVDLICLLDPADALVFLSCWLVGMEEGGGRLCDGTAAASKELRVRIADGVDSCG